MKRNLFLKSYSELCDFINECDIFFKDIHLNCWTDLKVDLASFSINRFTTSEKLRLEANDYFKKIIPEYNYKKGKDFLLDNDLYTKIIMYILEKKKGKNSLGKIKHHLDSRTFEIHSKYGFAFICYEDEGFKDLKEYLINKLGATYELVADGDLFYLSWFQLPMLKTGDESHQWFSRSHNIKIVSLYSLLMLVLRFQEDNLNGFFTVEDQNFFEENGYLVKEGFLDPDTLQKLSKITYDYANLNLSDGSAYLYGNENKLQRIYNLIGKSKYYVDLILDKRLEFFLEYFFSRDTLHQKYYLSSYQANILYPGAESQILHTDLAIPEPLPAWPVRLNLNIVLDEFTNENGATLVVPGSHKLLHKPDPYLNEAGLKKLTAKAGSLVIWTGHLWHKSGSNETTKPRAALLACFAASYMREIAVEENYLSVNSQAKISEFPKKLFDWLGGSHGIKISS
jgi:ectoine hydroxylase-related dioxygenase (phytanoyl-CoA dioxygenase family)